MISFIYKRKPSFYTRKGRVLVLTEEKKVSRRGWIKYAGAGVVVVAAAAGAGYYATQPKPTPTPTPTPTTPTPTTPTPTTPTLTQLTWWHNDDRPDWIRALDIVIRGFLEKNPNVTIKKDVIGWDPSIPKIKAAIAAKSSPDIGMGWNYSHILYAALGGVEPVDDLVDRINIKDIYKFDVNLHQWKGKFWGVTEEFTPDVLWYRKDWFKEKGLKVPTTWDEYLEAAKALTDKSKGVYGIAGTYALNRDGDKHPWGFIAANGGRIFDEKYNVIFDNPQTVEAIDFIKQLWPYTTPESLTNTTGTARVQLLNDKAGMMVTSSSFINDILLAIGRAGLFEKFGVALVPKRVTRAAFTVNPNYFVFKFSKNIDLAKKFLEYLMTDGYINYITNTVIGFLPVKYSVAQSKEYLEAPRIKPYVDYIKSSIETLEFMSIPGAENGMNPYVGEINARFILPTVVQDVLVKGLTPQQAVKNGQSLIEKVVKDLGPP